MPPDYTRLCLLPVRVLRGQCPARARWGGHRSYGPCGTYDMKEATPRRSAGPSAPRGSGMTEACPPTPKARPGQAVLPVATPLALAAASLSSASLFKQEGTRPPAGQRAPHTCTSWYAYAAMWRRFHSLWPRPHNCYEGGGGPCNSLPPHIIISYKNQSSNCWIAPCALLVRPVEIFEGFPSTKSGGETIRGHKRFGKGEVNAPCGGTWGLAGAQP